MDLTWDQVWETANGSVSFVSHNRSHPPSNIMCDEEVHMEAAGSNLEIKRQPGRVIEAFAYPLGLFRPEQSAILRHGGLRSAYVGFGPIYPNCDPYPLSRIVARDCVGKVSHLANSPRGQQWPETRRKEWP